MENFLRSKELWGLVEIGYEEPTYGTVQTEAQRKKLEESRLKDMKVKNFLFQAIDRTILETILEKNTSKQIWESMKRKFEGRARVKRSHLQAPRKEFETLEMKIGEGVSEYFSRVLTVANKMRTYGEQMQDVIIVEKILRSLNENFNYVEQNKHSKLVMMTKQVQEGRGRGANRGRGRGRRQSYNKATIERFKCHKLGHFQYECPSWDKEANYVEQEEEGEERLLMSYVKMKDDQRKNIWFLDSRCSNHMCGDKNEFEHFDETFRQKVTLGNNTKLNVLGKGNVRLKVSGFSYTVREVFFVPELKNNLLTIVQLQEKGLAILIQGGTLKFYHPDKGLIIQTEIAKNRMFVLRAEPLPQNSTCLYTSTCDLATLWHYRYGH
eukprot:XP_025012109.1 uncharacterized protein LOC112533883 [Ricinus communis]